MRNIPKIRIAAYIGGALIAVAGPLAFAGLMLTGSGKPRAVLPMLTVVSAGSAAPDFALPTHDGRTLRLSDYRGRAVFLVFVPDFDSPDTVAQVRSLARTERAFNEAGAKVLLIGAGDAIAAEALHEANNLPFPVLLDAGGVLARRYGVGAGMRRTFVVSPVGQVKFRLDAAVVDVQNHGTQIIKIGGCCLDDVQAARAEGVGKPLGNYSLPLANGGEMTTVFGNDTQKATAVLFLSAKCPCSNSYNKRIAVFAKAYANRPEIRLVGVYANKDESAAEIAEHATTHGFAFPVLHDADGLGAKHFGASVTPQAFVIDADHVLRYAGRIDDSRDAADAKTHDFADAVNAVASGKPAPESTRAFGCAIVK